MIIQSDKENSLYPTRVGDITYWKYLQMKYEFQFEWLHRYLTLNIKEIIMRTLKKNRREIRQRICYQN